uniref:ORF3 protein n=1 Tax=Porcine epidemic diarrhea virus TaxID=28295 RepID=A0A0H4KP62_PEDV|nr:hypothetical protein [Porcine epidemic diarrhea virus]QCQ19979.1 ORF3 protein [Porcine epidemic diarrhea virus]
MFLGLFQYTIDTVVKDVSKSANLSSDAVQELELNVVPIRQASNVTGFLFTSVFIYFFALFKASSLRRNYVMLAARFAVIFLYCPLLYYCGAFLDATIICCTLIGRLFLVCFYSWRYKNALFIIFNTTTLSFLNGKAAYYDGKSIVILEGGDHYITFGNSFVAFVSSINLYLAIRGRQAADLHLLRTVELLDGKKLYVFSQHHIVGITNAAFDSIQLDEYATISE